MKSGKINSEKKINIKSLKESKIFSKLINEYKIPIHITYAIDDEDVPLDSILKAIELVPNAKTFSFKGGHNIINSRTEEIVSLINDFKESLNN